jgi:hypothetical protein
MELETTYANSHPFTRLKCKSVKARIHIGKLGYNTGSYIHGSGFMYGLDFSVPNMIFKYNNKGSLFWN